MRLFFENRRGTYLIFQSVCHPVSTRIHKKSRRLRSLVTILELTGHPYHFPGEDECREGISARTVRGGGAAAASAAAATVPKPAPVATASTTT